MADLNKVMLIGRLTRDPQLRYLPNQQAVCDFGLATGRKFKTASGEEREETTFVDCTVFAKGAEIFNQYMNKGKMVFLEGRLKFDQWDDKTTGAKRSKLSVVVDNFQFLGGKGEGGGGNDEGGQSSSGSGYSRSGGFGGDNAGGGGPQAARRPASARPAGGSPQRPQQSPPSGDEPPFGDDQQFKEDEIPF